MTQDGLSAKIGCRQSRKSACGATNQIVANIPVGKAPCSGLGIGFDSVGALLR